MIPNIVSIQLNKTNVAILKHILDSLESNSIHKREQTAINWYSGNKKSFIKRQIDSIEFIKSILDEET